MLRQSYAPGAKTSISFQNDALFGSHKTPSKTGDYAKALGTYISRDGTLGKKSMNSHTVGVFITCT
jgi:hypothetical protein